MAAIERQTGLKLPENYLQINENYAIEWTEEAGEKALIMHYTDIEHPERSRSLGVLIEHHRVYGHWIKGKNGENINLHYWAPEHLSDSPDWPAGGDWLIADDSNNRLETLTGAFGSTNPDGTEQILPEELLPVPGDHRLSHGGAWKKNAWKRFGVTWRQDENGISMTTRRLVTSDLPEDDPNYLSYVLLPKNRIETKTTTLTPTGVITTLEITALEDLVEGGGTHPYYALFKNEDGTKRSILVMPSTFIWKTRDDLVTTGEFEKIEDTPFDGLMNGRVAAELAQHKIDTGFVLEPGQHPLIIHPALGVTLELRGQKGNLATGEMEDLSTGLIYMPMVEDPEYVCDEVTDPTRRRTLNYMAKRDGNTILEKRTEGLPIAKGQTRGFRWETMVHFHSEQQAA